MNLDAAADAPVPDAPAERDGEARRDYGRDGPETVSTFSRSVVNGSHSFTLHLYVPGSAGPHPVVVLSPGLLQPAAAYAPYGQRLASWGIVTVMRDDPGLATVTTDVAADLTYVVATWLPGENANAASMLAGRVDLARVGLAGHSRGGKASLLAAEMSLHGMVKAWFGIDPIDSSVLSGGAQARDGIGAIGIPTAFLGASISTTCSPAADNYEVLYAAAPSPSVALTGVGASHTQFEDPATCASCDLCTPAGTANGATVLSYSVRYLTAFFARELLGDGGVGATFAGAGEPSDEAAGLIQSMSK